MAVGQNISGFPALLLTRGPRFPQEGCLNVVAQRHCLACRTFLVCLRRSAMQVLTCNTTAVQFVSRHRGRSPPSGGSAALAFAPLRLRTFPESEHLGWSNQWTGLGQVACQKLSPAECLWQVRGPGIDLYAIDQISACHSL